VVFVAFAVRAAALWAAAGAPLILDELTYTLRALALLDGRGFLGSYQSWVLHDDGSSAPAELPQYPGAWQPPGQTLFMAAVLAVSERSVAAVRWVQVVLGTLSVWLVYALGRAWLDHRHGLVAAWLAALYPDLIAFCHYLWSETLFIFLFLSALWLATRRREPPPAPTAAAAGLLFGLAALTRALVVPFLPLFVAWLVWARPGRRRRALAAGAWITLAAALAMLPWTLRSTLLHGGFVLIDTNGAYNFWRGNGPDAFADRGDPAAPHYAWPFEGVPLAPVMNRPVRRLVAEAREALGSQRPSDLEIVGYARRAAWQEIRSAPGRFAARIRYRLADLWNPTSFLMRHFRIGAYGRVPPAVEGLASAAAALSYLLVMGLAAGGLWCARRCPEVWLVALLALLLSAISALSFGLTRFRLPLMPLAMIPAAAGLLALGARLRPPRAAAAAAAALLLAPGLGACRADPPPRGGPNVLWVLWDTVRADHLSLYGHPRPTTPRLDAWAAGARVFENAVSTAGYTIPSHASLFTGLLPSEHCTHNANERLDDRFETLAELLRAAGYQTFLYSENPNISAEPGRNFAQGFDEVVHPWSPAWLDEALRIVHAKLPDEERSSELRERLAAAHRGERPLTPWNVKAAGEIGERALRAWLASADRERPWFAFLNYMEAHRPTIPPRRYRERLMSADEVAASYGVDRSWVATWEYVFGLREYSRAELELTRKTYDAALLELDDLFGNLLEALAADGHLADTVVILSSDHGEHLGEQHRLDHQYSVHEAVLRVPLVVRDPARFPPGRSASPVVNFDLFPTVLELAGLTAPAGLDSAAQSLLAPQARRARLAEEPAASDIGIEQIRRLHPDWDPTPFRRRLRAFTDEPWKLIWRSDARHSLYDLSADPGETRDLVAERPERARELLAALERFRAPRSRCRVAPSTQAAPEPSPEQRERLRTLGYLEGPEGAGP
jgi:arylsulfatase A-like enzyme/4-amino-4-deoxy-L-arabinose transferase-like glycosyltransferase